MLRRALAAAAASALITAITLVVAPAPVSLAAGECPPGSTPIYEDAGGEEILVGCVDSGEGGGGNDGGGASAGGGSDTRQCTWRGAPISCGTSTWSWYQPGECYARVADPQPDADHPAWEGRAPGEGVLLQCIQPRTGYDFACDAADGCGEAITWLWSAAPPDAGPSPVELARRALVGMRLSMGQIGVTGGNPEGTGWRTVIGLPIWLWVDNPAPNTTGPITATASDSGLTVTATATLDRIEWMLASPAGVLSTTCSGQNAAGTPYRETYGSQPSPNCGWTVNQIQNLGSHTLTGTAYWTVEWTGGGEIGTLAVDPISESMQLEVLEVQTIRTEGG